MQDTYRTGDEQVKNQSVLDIADADLSSKSPLSQLHLNMQKSTNTDKQ